MITKYIHVFFLFVLASLLLACNDKPDFHYSDTKPGKYQDFEGQWLVINYWAAWCKPCIEEIPELNKLDQDNKNVQVLGINFDSVNASQLTEQMHKLNIQFHTAIASPHKQYHYDYPKVLPSTVIITPRGSVKKILIGPQTQAKIQHIIAN